MDWTPGRSRLVGNVGCIRSLLLGWLPLNSAATRNFLRCHRHWINLFFLYFTLLLLWIVFSWNGYVCTLHNYFIIIYYLINFITSLAGEFFEMNFLLFRQFRCTRTYDNNEILINSRDFDSDKSVTKLARCAMMMKRRISMQVPERTCSLLGSPTQSVDVLNIVS